MSYIEQSFTLMSQTRVITSIHNQLRRQFQRRSPISNRISITQSSTRNFTMSTAAMQNEYGQGVSHATDNSKVPGKIQEKAPEGLERKLPEDVCSPQPALQPRVSLF
ncbi:hypothetical protein ACMFMG_000571 [Clarireedia jacksonii]